MSSPRPVCALGPLRPGARVALLSASGPATGRGVERGTELLRAWGLEPVPYPSATATHPTASYLAGPDARRASDVEEAWCDPGIDAILTVRGDHGSVRILDRLDVDRMRAAAPKPLFGSSDVTALLEWLGEMLGVCSWHAPMIGTRDLLDDPVATEHLRAALLLPWDGRVLRGAASAETLVPGRASGRLIGGNLSLLAGTLGARRRPPIDHRGAIAVLEDVGEDTYKFDGYLTALLRAGWFDVVRGVVLGGWRDCDLDEVRALVEELLVPLGVPLVWEFGFGHGPASACLPLGVDAVLDAGDAPTLTLNSPGGGRHEGPA